MNTGRSTYILIYLSENDDISLNIPLIVAYLTLILILRLTNRCLDVPMWPVRTIIIAGNWHKSTA